MSLVPCYHCEAKGKNIPLLEHIIQDPFLESLRADITGYVGALLEQEQPTKQAIELNRVLRRCLGDTLNYVRALDAELHRNGYRSPATSRPVKPIEDEGLLRCASCDSDQFHFEESHPSTREMARNSVEEGLVFYDDFQWFDGDADPGVVCSSCGREIDTIDVEVQFI